MRVCKQGQLHEGLWCLGTEESCVYLLESGGESIIISAGMHYILPSILQQFLDFRIDTERIRSLLILHSHFDHVGTVPYFRRTYPDLTIYASRRSSEILRSPKAVTTINQFNRSAALWAGIAGDRSDYGFEWEHDFDCIVVGEGDTILIGDMPIQIFDTPGHSSCSISAYLPRLRALFPSDGGGIPFKETIITSGNSDYTLFQQSLEKLNELEVDFLCADHYGYVVGHEAGNFIGRAIEIAKDTRRIMEAAYAPSKDVGLAARQLSKEFSQKNPGYVLPPEINEVVYRQMLRHLAKSFERGM